MTPYRTAIIGTGSTAGAHIKSLKQAGDRVEVVATCDIDEAVVREFCQKHNIPRWYTNANELFAREAPLDLVHIVTPPGNHFSQIMAALDAGAWVHCEKPLVLSLDQFDRISEAEARTGRYVSTVFQWRFGSAGKHLKNLIQTGELGRPLVGVCLTLWYRDLDYYHWPWRGQWAQETGGVASVMGIHLTDLFLWLMGDWQQVRAEIRTLDRPIEVEDVAMAIVQFENGAMGSITSSSVSPRQESYLRLDFQRATVDVTGVYGYANANWRYNLYEGSMDHDSLERWRAIEHDIPSSHSVQIAELLDSMDRNERPLISGPEARRIIEFLAGMYKSAMTGEAVQRGSIQSGDPFYYSMNGSLNRSLQNIENR